MDLTYECIAPHLERGLQYRRLRQQRWRVLHEHDGRATFWRIAAPGLVLFWGLVAYAVFSL